ncbi:hypothetical protein APR50_24115 [Variovorax paradoxus]|uniref:pilus assembly protein n=1 Tax=Variovorax paradoxus TaxID=34073 RepID=UPI0006E4DA1C|nr:hypothetical protein APR52_28955 [Variovorax paradoxus]KPV03671.1 hypothetical protein APR50_24115 [Variovorax paradoxus]KPV06056.1 hypothetical protein APR49_20610 [Variovorax paradoxus]KPV19064.1 hypothetical protein APR51_21535 [Variovorax paradoxus]KPV29805.1 hypothetical protein APR48_21640 [Variovorax paradoxus]
MSGLNALVVFATLSLLGMFGLTGRGNAATEISDVPLITSPNVQALPNLMFVLDDSGSMAYEYMPDNMSGTTRYGYWSSQCNGVAYNPALTYTPPIKADGTSYANATFGSAWSDGFGQTGSDNLGATTTETLTRTSTSSVAIGTGSKTFTVDLGESDDPFVVGAPITARNATNRWMTGTVTAWSGSGSTRTLIINVTSSSSSGTRASWDISQDVTVGTRYYNAYNGTQPAMSWAYSPGGSVNTNTTFYQECRSTIGSSPGNGVFRKVRIANLTAEQKQNYANWYAYYRSRTLLMRTAVGRAFASLNGGYRVGFSTINSSKTTSTSDGFQPISAFEGTQRSSVYTKLYGATASGTTPLRGALSKIGRYYSGKFITTNEPDPIQYACQRNYVLLSTDGYWNTGDETSRYGPDDMDGNDVGNQDGREAKPMSDGTNNYTLYSRTTYTVSSTRYSRNTCASNTASSTGTYYRVTTQAETSTDDSNWSNSGSGSVTCSAGSGTVYNSQTAASLAGRNVSTPSTASDAQSGGSSNTLADVAQYYYKNDLRTTNCTSSSSGISQNVCANVVPTSGRDNATHQHMTTFTIGLGVSGTLTYDRNYLTQASGDYADLVSGAKSWPVPPETESGGDARNIDDLWHAAVNGRGQYYSALNATQLAEAISGVVNSIQEVTGSSAAATTSTLELVTGDNNQVYSASYTTGSWIGDLKAFALNGDNGTISTTATWSAQARLTATSYTARNIYYRQPTTNALRTFDWTSLNADGYGANFTGLCDTSVRTGVTQCTSGLSDSEKTAANDGARLVNYLRGERTYESANTGLGTTRALYRARTGLLGDIINGAPRYVSKPNFEYNDAGYGEFARTRSNRKPMLYVAANDGMLHAISADSTDGSGGREMWAYVPTAVMRNLYRLADSDYASKHRYFVDGAPVVGDVYVDGAWKTILIGGLGKGGRSYYALDITDPLSPRTLWEFNDDNLGLSYGNPVITKRTDGSWVVVFASGYNNVTPGDGVGRLFVLNAYTGTRSRTDITTGVGTTDNPSGLAKINGWIDQEADNTSKRFYGGDLLGNLWRIDIDGVVEPFNAALRLATFQLNATTPQPITTRPRLTEVNGKPVIVVGTGRYLGTSDITDTTMQSVYAVKDSLTNTGLGDVRNNNTLVQQTFSVSGNTATITNQTVNWATNNGWWVDLPHSGERLSTDIALQSGVLAIGTAIPTGDACSSGGSSWNYTLSTSNGSALQNVAGSLVSANSVIVGQSFVRMADGRLRLLRQLSDGSTSLEETPTGSNSNIVPQRTSWRELAD